MPSKKKRQLRVFLCHSVGDKPAVRFIFNKLSALGIDSWFDEENLVAGQKWPDEISKAIRGSDVVIVFISRRSVSRRGFVNTEISIALEITKQMPEGSIFLIPVLLEKCKVPYQLSDFHWIKLENEEGYRKLIQALQVRGQDLRLDTNLIDKYLTQTLEKSALVQKDTNDIGEKLLAYLTQLSTNELHTLYTLLNAEGKKQSPTRKSVLLREIVTAVREKKDEIEKIRTVAEILGMKDALAYVSEIAE